MHPQRLRYILFFILVAVTMEASNLQSPDGQLKIAFQTVSQNQPTPSGGQLTYSVSFAGKPLIDSSNLSLELEGERPLGENVRMIRATPSSKDETYRLVTGKASSVRDHYNALRMEFEEPGG